MSSCCLIERIFHIWSLIELHEEEKQVRTKTIRTEGSKSYNKKEKEENRRDGLHTKANRELNSPGAVQAAPVIPWKPRAEDDATEVCHRASTLSWGDQARRKNMSLLHSNEKTKQNNN